MGRLRSHVEAPMREPLACLLEKFSDKFSRASSSSSHDCERNTDQHFQFKQDKLMTMAREEGIMETGWSP